MDIFNVFALLGGLAFFLFGMNILSGNLQKMAGGKLERMLQRLTDNKLLGLLFGMVITIAIQSSSAMTVMLVGFVNSGIMKVSQTISVIMGSDIGTTLTAWILSLTGVESNNVFIKLLNPKYFSPIVALIGILLYMVSKSEKRKNIGAMLLGFSILMTGMTSMSTAMSPLKDMPEFQNLLLAFSNPLLGVLIGMVVTAVVQSSAATIGILQALSLTGSITYGMAIPIVMGENIGTCMTAILSSIGVNRKAKRVAAIHVAIKVIGTVVILALYYVVMAVFNPVIMTRATSPVDIALIHTVFNLAIVAMTFPFQKQLEKLSNWIIKDKEDDTELFLDERLFVTPAVALGECNQAMMKMTELTEKSLDIAIDLVYRYDPDDMTFLNQNEDRIDNYEDALGSYIMKLNAHGGLSADSRIRTTKILFGINEFERLADHALNVAHSAEELHEKGLKYSAEAQKEVDNLIKAVREIYNLAIESYREDNLEKASCCAPLQAVIEELCDEYKENHVNRIQMCICGGEQGFVFNDFLTACSRITGHSMNIAASILRSASSRNKADAGYMHDIKSHTNKAYAELYDLYFEKYGTKQA
ncbi:MAG: Na/Pi cotransporter family protein [Lachnospiraceae bacterium]|nr:Na/Pi cotransporter family protein [Lachnospiraceae bacterium]